MLRAFFLLWAIALLLPSSVSAGGSSTGAGKGYVHYDSFANSPDQAFIRDYVEHEEFYAEAQRDEAHLWGVQDFDVGYHDLNDDGIPELFISYPDLSAWYCGGTAGCEKRVFQMRNGRWELLHLDTGGPIWVSDEMASGYRTFYVSHGLVLTTKYEWDGTEYHSSCVENMPAETGSNVTTRCY